MRLLRYIGRRLLLFVPVVLGVSVITFMVVRILPGDPVYTVVPQTATEADIQAARERLGLDQPLLAQYWDFLRGFVQGDLGTSIQTGTPVHVELARRIAPTLELITFAIALALVFAVILGVIAAFRVGRTSDHVLRILALAGNSMPEFWLGLVFILIFYATLGWAPAPSGRLDPGLELQYLTGFASVDALLTGNWAAFRSALAHLTLPVLTLAIVVTAPLMRSVRGAALDVIHSDAYACAEAHGLARSRLVWRYLLRDALSRLPTLAALVFGYLLGGAVLIEFVFSWQGLGQWALRALLVRDYPVIQTFVMLAAGFYVLIFLIADVLQSVLDPRVRV